MSKFALYIQSVEKSQAGGGMVAGVDSQVGAKTLGIGFVLFGVVSTIVASIFFVRRSKEIEADIFRPARSALIAWIMAIVVTLFGLLGIDWIGL